MANVIFAQFPLRSCLFLDCCCWWVKLSGTIPCVHSNDWGYQGGTKLSSQLQEMNRNLASANILVSSPSFPLCLLTLKCLQPHTEVWVIALAIWSLLSWSLLICLSWTYITFAWVRQPLINLSAMVVFSKVCWQKPMQATQSSQMRFLRMKHGFLVVSGNLLQSPTQTWYAILVLPTDI